jgi:hypothetical protein
MAITTYHGSWHLLRCIEVDHKLGYKLRANILLCINSYKHDDVAKLKLHIKNSMQSELLLVEIIYGNRQLKYSPQWPRHID